MKIYNKDCGRVKASWIRQHRTALQYPFNIETNCVIVFSHPAEEENRKLNVTRCQLQQIQMT